MTNQEKDAIFTKAFDQMSDTFTSKEFCTLAKKAGIPQLIINKGYASEYLHRYCNKMHKRNIWVKQKAKLNNSERIIQPMQTIIDGTTKPQHNNSQITESSAIAFLKAKGYKILRPEFKEI